MARPTAEYNTKNPTARARLKPRRKPYYRSAGGVKSLGYIRRATGPGTWIVREWSAGRYITRSIGFADDIGRADGADILTYEQALRKATAPELPSSRGAGITVAVALENYLASREAAKPVRAKEDRQRAQKHITPKLGRYRVDRLSKTQIEKWLASLVHGDDESEERRRSQDSANRILTILKAALNHAAQDEANDIKSDAAWRRVKPFKNVGGAREDQFDAAQVRGLVSKAATFDAPFAHLIEAGYLTGCRLGELTALNVRDFDASDRTLRIRAGKTGDRIITLTGESTAFFKARTEGRPGNAVLFPRADGDRWGKSEQARPFKRAAALAGLPATASFYTLRHSHISRAIESRMPLSLVAEQCGTSLSMIERTYAKVLAKTRGAFVEETSPRLRRVK
jgi:integrase